MAENGEKVFHLDVLILLLACVQRLGVYRATVCRWSACVCVWLVCEIADE